MNTTCFISLFIIFLLVSLAIGKYSSGRIKSSKDYYLSGRQVGIFGLSLTFLATQLGGGAIIGAADAAFNYGISAIYYAFGISLGLIGLSLGIGRKWREHELSTVPELFSKRYHDESLYRVASVVYVISTFLILVAIAVATRKYLAALGLTQPLLFLAFWCILIYYTSLGGLKAVVQTDVMQISLVLLIFVGTFMFMNTPSIDLSATINPSNKEVPWTSWLLMPFLFTLIGQDMGQRCFAGRSPKAVTIATAIAGALLIAASLLPTYLGMVAQVMALPISANESVLMQTISQLTDPYTNAFFAFAVLMALISTADSLLCSISSNVALDIVSIESYSTKAIKKAKWITFLTGLLAYGLCYLTNDIIPIMVKAYEITIVCFFVPIFWGLLLKKPSRMAARLSSITGIVCYVGLNLIALGLPEAVIALVLSQFAYWIGISLNKQPTQNSTS